MDREIAASLGVPPGNPAVQLATASYEKLRRELRCRARLNAALHRCIHTAATSNKTHTVYLGGDYKLCCTGTTVDLVHMRLAPPEDGAGL